MGSNLGAGAGLHSVAPTSADPGSETRIRVAPRVSSEDPSARLAAAGRPLQLLARRLLSLGERLERAALDAWRVSTHDEPDRVDLASDGALSALLQAMGGGHELAAQSISVSWFAALTRDGASLLSLTLLVEAIEDTARSSINDESALPQLRELSRFLMRVAVLTHSDPASLETALASAVVERGQGTLGELGLVGVSPAMARLRQELRDIGDSRGSVLLVGESGTGKELVAKALHDLAGAERPFIALNCAALPRELFESELFGHERGSFTGSREASLGLLRAAENGTIFLDEITEMPEALQPKLLRALEQRTVRPVGGVREFPIRARVIAATNRDLSLAVKDGHFRADLFFRVCVHRISLPTLRERVEDIPALCELFLRQLAESGHRVSRRPTDAALAELTNYEFPGNVRELRNVIEHSAAVARGVPIEPRHLPRYFGHWSNPRAALTPAAARVPSGRTPGASAPPLVPLHQVEREHILHALEQAQGNKALAARMLGVSRHQLYVKLERLAREE